MCVFLHKMNFPFYMFYCNFTDSSIDIRLEKPTRPTNTSTNIKTAANRSTDEEFCIIDDAGLGIAVSSIFVKIHLNLKSLWKLCAI